VIYEALNTNSHGGDGIFSCIPNFGIALWIVVYTPRSCLSAGKGPWNSTDKVLCGFQSRCRRCGKDCRALVGNRAAVSRSSST